MGRSTGRGSTSTTTPRFMTVSGRRTIGTAGEGCITPTGTFTQASGWTIGSTGKASCTTQIKISTWATGALVPRTGTGRATLTASAAISKASGSPARRPASSNCQPQSLKRGIKTFSPALRSSRCGIRWFKRAGYEVPALLRFSPWRVGSAHPRVRRSNRLTWRDPVPQGRHDHSLFTLNHF